MTPDAKISPAPASKAAAEANEGNEPIILDMGKKPRKQVRKLIKGKPGRLMNRVEEAMDHLREQGALATGAQAVVIVIRQRPKRRGRRITKAWGLG